MSTTEGKSQGINWILLVIISVILVIALWIGLRIAFPDKPTIFAGTRPDSLGVKAGKLAPCLPSPNCVSSQSEDETHYIPPLSYEGNPQTAMTHLQDLLRDRQRVHLVAEEANYLYAEFSSRWLGFVDDVEFYLNQDRGQIEVRSASRLGESDLGVNRQRLETIRYQLTQNT